MDDAVQAAAYAQGDFAAAHQFLVNQAGRLLGDLPPVAGCWIWAAARLM